MADIHNFINRQVPTVLHCEKEYDLKPGECYGPIIRNVYIIECCVEGYGSVIINEKNLPYHPEIATFFFPVIPLHTQLTQQTRERDTGALLTDWTSASFSEKQEFLPTHRLRHLSFSPNCAVA